MASALVGVLSTGNALALGLGDIETKSTLNQPFVAEVELLSATDDELNELKVDLASDEAFSRAGIDRSVFLTHLNFSVSHNASGHPVIRVTSREAVTEPFLDFLMEVSWSKGRLLREYTVLIDPPVTMPAPPVRTEAPKVSSVAVPASAVDGQLPSENATAQSYTTQRTGAASRGASQYGPTRRNDTLWQIAAQVRPGDDVSVEQTMLAILKSNPEAFVDNNINNLKAGYVLRIPDKAEITTLSKSEARNQARSQYTTWQASKAGNASGAASVAEPEATGTPSLQLLAPDASEGGAGPAGASGNANIDTLKRDVVLANEALEAQRLEAADANARVLVLQEQIQNMHRLIDLKDSELARLQAIVGEKGTVSNSDTAESASADSLANANDSHVPAEASAPTAPVVTPTVSPTTGEATEIDQASGAETATSAGGTTEASNEVALASGAGTEPAAPMASQSPPAQENATSPSAAEPQSPSLGERANSIAQSVLAKLTGNPVWLGVAGALLLLAAMFGLRRKQTAQDSDFQESILRSPNDEDQLDEGVSGITPPVTETSQGSHSSLLSEFAVSDMVDSEGEGAADPLAEADVYLAYGRYQQAADLVQEAMESDPGREELDLKLLEIYQASGQDSEFDAHAQSVLERLGDSEHPLWKRISEMGISVNPRNPIYTLGLPAGADAGSSWAETGQSWVDAEDQAPASSDILESAEIPATLDDVGQSITDNSLDFDLAGFDLDDEDGEDGETGDGQLADLDEVSTKLDLARAYIDMGDSDGARSILDEVIEEGTDEQRSEAHEILQRLAS